MIYILKMEDSDLILQYEKILEDVPEEKVTKKKKKTKKSKSDVNELLKNVSIPKGLELESIDLEKAQFLCSLTKIFRNKS